MTTESTHHTRKSGVSVLLGTAAVTLVLGGITSGLGAAVGGSAAAYGALVGTALVVGVLAFGSFVVNVVAGLMPAAALLVALLTYTLQVVVMGLVFVALKGSGLLESTLDRRWLAGAVIAGTFGWIAAQIVLSMRARIPAYDLPEAGAR